MLTSQRKALDSGADLFLPKPLLATHIDQLWRSIAAPKQSLELWVVDDDEFFLEMWREQSSTVRCFAKPEDCFIEASKSTSRPAAIVIDQNFSNSSITGTDLGKQLRSLPNLVNCLFYLATDDHILAKPSEFHRRLTKDPHHALSQILSDLKD